MVNLGLRVLNLLIVLMLNGFTYGDSDWWCQEIQADDNPICFKLNATADTFWNAMKTCHEDGGTLAIINNNETIDFLEHHLATAGITNVYVWIGVYRRYDIRSMQFLYINMLDMVQNILPWRSREPSFNGDCVYLFVGTKKIGDLYCAASNPFLCSDRSNSESTMTPISQLHTTTASDPLTSSDAILKNITTDYSTYVKGTTLLDFEDMDIKTLTEKINSIKRDLKVNKSSISSYIRAKTSAPDSRTSSTVIGNCLGLGLIVTILLLTFLSDLPLLIRHLRNIY